MLVCIFSLLKLNTILIDFQNTTLLSRQWEIQSMVLFNSWLLILFNILLAGLKIEGLLKYINIFFILSKSFEEIMIWAISFQFFIVVHALVVLAKVDGVRAEYILFLAKISTLFVRIWAVHYFCSSFCVCWEKFVLCFELLHW